MHRLQSPSGLLRLFVYSSTLLCFACISLMTSSPSSRLNQREVHHPQTRNGVFEKTVRRLNGEVRVNDWIDESDVTPYLPHLPDVNKSTCSPILEAIKLATPHTMPRVALASYPRSGNTWSRMLIQVATQLYTTSVYWKDEGQLPRSNTVFKGNKVDHEDGQGVCTKTHEHDNFTLQFFNGGAILLIRNPLKSAISDYVRCSHDHHIDVDAVAKNIESDSNAWKRFRIKRYDTWKAMAIDWVKAEVPLLIVYYEDLIANPARELIRMVKFLKQPIDLTRIQCAVYEYPPRDRRYEFLVPLRDNTAQDAIRAVNETLLRLRVRPLPSYDSA